MVVMGIQGQLGTTLMTISDLAAIDAEVKVAEADVLRIALGQTNATVTLEAIPGTPFPGRVVEIGASALPVSGTGAAAREFKVKVRLDSPDARLRPGLTCDAEVLTAERQNVLVVPLQAVVVRVDTDGRDRTGVFVVDGRTARFRQVTTGLIGGLDIEVSGVTEGTAVVTGPFQAVGRRWLLWIAWAAITLSMLASHFNSFFILPFEGFLVIGMSRAKHRGVLIVRVDYSCWRSQCLPMRCSARNRCSIRYSVSGHWVVSRRKRGARFW